MFSIVINEIGKKYGKLSVIERDEHPSKSREAKWICRCECGKISSIYGASLRKGLSKSCGCSKEIDETGNRYGRLLVIKRDSEKHTKWICKCSCGKEVSVFGNNLRNSNTKSCGCITTKIHIPSGNVFSHLTVIKQSDRKSEGGQIMWVCRCGCGKIVDVASSDLRKGSRTRCGPDCPKFGVVKGDASFNVMLYGMKKGAKIRGHAWNLTKDQVREITKRNCFYCGKVPSQKPSGKLNGDYIYNGIDRIDNSRGYDPMNVVPCCIVCNRAKSTLGVSDFRKWVISVCNHWASH